MYLWQEHSPSNLGFYRPNQAMNRVYSGYASLKGLGAPPVFSIAQLKTVRPLAGLGQSVTGSISTPMLLGGAALLGLGALFLFRRKGGSSDKKRIARLAAQRALATKALRESGA